MDYYKKSLEIHKKYQGKLEIISKVPLRGREDLSVLYTPGVAEPCRMIAENPETAYDYTIKGNLVAVITDSSAVLGLGNLGGVAGLPVMEGKSLLMKRFANVDSIPICLDTQDVDEIVETIVHIAPTFGGINLEDISAPRCFEIERRLRKRLNIPVFHDDQHGTAIVTLAGLINAFKVVKKKFSTAKIVMSGAGAAGIGTVRLLLKYGVKEVILCDSDGVIYEGRKDLNPEKKLIAEMTNPHKLKGKLADAMKGADVFIGISCAKLVSEAMVRSMAKDAIVFAMANPSPEILPDEALRGGARVAASGRSDFPNQINNVLAFPGVFRGLLDVRAREISDDMYIAAAEAIAGFVKKPHVNKIVPTVFEPGLAQAVANAIKKVYKSGS